MDDRFLKDLISKGSVLLTAQFSQHVEEQLYRTVFESSAGIKCIIWVCYQHAPEDVEKKLSMYSIPPMNSQFIDMISHTMGLRQDNPKASYCTSPTDYGCLSRLIDEKLDRAKECLIVIDNLNAMMSYDNLPERFIKALRSLNNRIPQRNSAVLYTAISGAYDRQTEIAINTTMDCVMQIDGTVKGKKEIEWENFKSTSWKEVFSLNAPVVFTMLIAMFAIIIFLSSLLIYLILKLQG